MFSSLPKKIALFVLIAVFVFVFSAAREEGEKNRQIFSEIDNLKNQADQLKKEKQNLSSLMAFFETETFKERELKKQLGLQKEGEKVILISEKKDLVVEGADEMKAEEESNLKKWVSFIFNDKNE